MSLVLPDCTAATVDRALLPRQRRDLVRILAQEGPEGVEAWLRREAAKDPGLRARFEAHRAELEREAQAQRRKLEDQHEQSRTAAEAKWHEEIRMREEREAALQERLASLSGEPVLSRDELLASSPLHRAILDPPRLTWWQRFRGWLRRVWIALVSWWVHVVRKVRGRPMPPFRHVVTLPDGVVVDVGAVGPDALLALRANMPRSKLRQAWDRLLGRNDYAEHVAKLMQQEQERLAEAQRRSRQAERERLEKELASLGDGAKRATDEHEARERERLEAHRRALEEVAKWAETAPLRRVQREILDDFTDAGLLGPEGTPTHLLVERFASVLYEQVRRGLPAEGQARPGLYVEGDGALETGRLRSLHEIGAMDLVQSVVRARVRHPRQRHIYDDDVVVHREVRTARAHVVVVFDTSGSMEEAGRLEAAKRVCLVLHQAVKDRDPTHRVDLLRMHTSVERVDLAGCWASTPMGFTNHGAAMREARRLFREEGAQQRLLYLVTDGLPEAYTKPDGTDKADRPDVCMEDALRHARRLRDVAGLSTTFIQLESRDERFVEAAHQLADAAGARVETLDPDQLVGWMVGDYDASAQAR